MQTCADYLLQWFTSNEIPLGDCVDVGREEQREREAKVAYAIFLCVTRLNLVEENETACSQYPWFESVAAAQRKVLRTPM